MNQLLDSVAIDCCTTLVPPGRANRVEVGDAQAPSDLVAVIGFSGDQIRGAIGLCASRDVLRATHPSLLAGAEPTQRDLEDWLGESANQLLGRFKAHLHRAGVSVWMGTPLVLRGVSVAVAPNGGARRYSLDAGDGNAFTFWLDAEIDAGADAKLTVMEPDETAPGDFLMF